MGEKQEDGVRGPRSRRSSSSMLPKWAKRGMDDGETQEWAIHNYTVSVSSLYLISLFTSL